MAYKIAEQQAEYYLKNKELSNRYKIESMPSESFTEFRKRIDN